jgi:hypothetical protein
VFGPDSGFFLPDGTMLGPDAAYVTADQMRGLTKERERTLTIWVLTLYLFASVKGSPFIYFQF